MDCLDASHHAHTLVQTVGDGIVERDPDDAGVLALAARAHVLDQLVEGVLLATVSRPHPNAATPDQERGGGFQHLRYVLVQGRLVEIHQALQTADVLGARRQRGDAEPTREAHPECLDLAACPVGRLVNEDVLLDPPRAATASSCV